MEKIFRFAVRRPVLIKVLLTLFPVLPLAVILAGTNISDLLRYEVIFLLVFLIFLSVNLSVKFLMDPKVRALNRNCDPIPLLEITGFLLTCRQPPAYRIAASMNHALALRDLGHCDEALKIMESIDWSRPRRIPPMVKFVYFHNSADMMDHLGRTEEADALHAQAMQTYTALPRRARSVLEISTRFARASAHCRHGEFSDAVSVLQDLVCTNPRQQVERGMLLARCAIALGQPQQAEEWLRYVMEHGNRLHVVQEARSILENMENI